MLKRVLIAAVATAFLGSAVLPSWTLAQTPAPNTTGDTKKAKAPKKPPSAKQKAARAKFSACAKSWGDHKKATGQKGQKAYRAYMSGCLKKT